MLGGGQVNYHTFILMNIIPLQFDVYEDVIA